MKKIVLCGGHLTPALTLIEELQKDKDLKLIFFGRKFSTEGSKNYSAEYRVIRDKKIQFYSITAGRFQRRFTRYTLQSIQKIPIGFLQAFVYLLATRPKVIVSFGGYLSTPIVFSGWLLGIDSITHEQASIPGLATKINSLFVKKIFLTWPESLNYFKSDKAEVIGNLMRRSALKNTISASEIDNFVKSSSKLILVSGGNQGSHVLNRLTFEIIKDLEDFSVLHQMGTANWHGDHQVAWGIKKRNYLPVDYINPEDFMVILKRAALVICRAGANTVWDLAAIKKPAILVPLPASSGGEQLANAMILKAQGIVEIVNQQDLTAKRILRLLWKMIKNLKKYERAAQNFQKSLPKDAAQKVTDFILSYT